MGSIVDISTRTVSGALDEISKILGEILFGRMNILHNYAK